MRVRIRLREALTLFGRDNPREIFDRVGVLSRRAEGRAGRKAVDSAIEKVLPPGSWLELAGPSAHPEFVEIGDCSYRPFFDRPLFALRDLVPEKSFEPMRSVCDELGDSAAEAASSSSSSLGARSPKPKLPTPMGEEIEEVRQRLLECVGVPYLWGGTTARGSRAQEGWLIERGFFRAEDRGDRGFRLLMRSAGLDCSGLLNRALEGRFLGDVKHFVSSGSRRFRPLPNEVRGDADAIAGWLQCLDVIAYPGHLMIALGDGRVIQAVGEGENAESFALATGWSGDPLEKYDRVVVDDAIQILDALVGIQGRRWAENFEDPTGDLRVLSLAESSPNAD